MTTTEMMLAFASVLFLGLWLHELTGTQKLRSVCRTGLRKAERDNCDRVRIPYNQLAEVMGWQPEFEKFKFERTPGRKARKADDHVRTSHFPVRGNR